MSYGLHKLRLHVDGVSAPLDVDDIGPASSVVANPFRSEILHSRMPPGDAVTDPSVMFMTHALLIKTVRQILTELVWSRSMAEKIDVPGITNQEIGTENLKNDRPWQAELIILLRQICSLWMPYPTGTSFAAPHKSPSISILRTFFSISFMSVSSSHGFTSSKMELLAIRAGFFDFLALYAARRSSFSLAASALSSSSSDPNRSTSSSSPPAGAAAVGFPPATCGNA
uniref:Uncharacterized protein n=1 Tax=Anopheles culicifacies TaxID=139723 RepID=A0A182LZY8_9DIPT